MAQFGNRASDVSEVLFGDKCCSGLESGLCGGKSTPAFINRVREEVIRFCVR